MHLATKKTSKLVPQTINVESHFGVLEISLEHKIIMSQGLVGLEVFKNYCLVPIPDRVNESDFLLLQSIDNHALCFIVMPIPAPDHQFCPYQIIHMNPFLDEYELKSSDISLYAIVSFHRNEGTEAKVSVNMKAPIILNNLTKQAWQVMLPGDTYSLRHYL